ncbi:hypothetical protein BU25DRAFT_408477 [Macroventuria anomochaeta]|uniref:Uncharacterized protein n=1 Tax=Macroventuria anomochaeta TaxID=301207 RepID=A0ACB6S6H9_9PLEO|nr:uncharacterized protein BU25DRAFT_408477 [Macroventuria anomochaeta]KAF2629870.1 hypothetical protein BU25DRAFT_408477 [Macroventuria anomochaeta]
MDARLGCVPHSHWSRTPFHAPPPKSTPHRTPQDLDRRFCTPPPSCTKTPFTAGAHHCSGFGGNARNLKLSCYRAGGEDIIRTNSSHPILRANNKCIS